MSSDAVVTLLVTQTWQVALSAILVWCIVRLAAGKQPHLAHALWALVLVKCLTPPIWSSPLGLFGWLEAGSRIGVNSTLIESDSDPTAQPLKSSDHPTIRVSVDRSFSSVNQPDNRTNFVQNNETKDATSTGIEWQWQAIVLIGWLAMCIGCTLVTILRLALFCARVYRHKQIPAPHIDVLLKELSVKFGVRCGVCLRIIDAAIGPAVFGLLRPTIVLPEVLVRGRGLRDIEPLLAHELVHIRRGDLWWALVQVLATCWLWFHPFVWLASKMLSRESEKACDEETIARLGCSPVSYARSLLDVLERKHQLRVAPALPGVRPVDITKKRMETIMQLGQGCRSKTPGWVWLVACIGALALLPAARFTEAQDDAQQLEGKVFPSPAAAAVAYPPPPRPIQPGEQLPYELEKYPVADIVTVCFPHATPEQVVVALCAHPRLGDPIDPSQSLHKGASCDFVADNGTINKLGRGERTIKLIDDKLYVYGDAERHKRIALLLADIRKFGFDAQVCVDLRVITVPTHLLKSLGIKWMPIETKEVEVLREEKQAPARVNSPNAIRTANRQNDDQTNVSATRYWQPVSKAQPIPGQFNWTAAASDPKTNSSVNQASATAPVPAGLVPKPLKRVSAPEVFVPAYCVNIDDDRMTNLMERIQSEKTATILCAPRVTIFNGMQAEISDIVQRPSLDQDQVVVAEHGWKARLRPTIAKNDSVDLAFTWNDQEIQYLDFTFEGQRPPVKVQQPCMTNETLAVKTHLPMGSTMLLSRGSRGSLSKEGKVLMLAVTCRVIDPAVQKITTLAPKHHVSDQIYTDNQLTIIQEFFANQQFNDWKVLPDNRIQVPGDQHSRDMLKAADEEVLRVKSEVEKSLPDVRIISSNPSIGRDFQPLIDALAKLGNRAVIEGDIEFEVDSNRIKISGTDLSIQFRSSGNYISAKQIQIQLGVGTNDLKGAWIRARGDVRFHLDQEVKAQADEIEVRGDISNISIKGNVKLTTLGPDDQQTRLEGDEIRTSDHEEIIVTGKAYISHPNINGLPIELRAHQFIVSQTMDKISGIVKESPKTKETKE